MITNGFTRKFKPLEILTEEQVEEIHRGTLDVLEQTGVRFESEKALKLLKENGCEVDFNKRRARFPPGLVEECLRKCPSSFHVKARDPRNDINLGGNTLYFSPFPGTQTVDLDTWEPRVPTRKEYYEGVTIIDALDSLQMGWFYSPYFGYKSIPPVMCIPESLAAQLRNSTKIQGMPHSQNCEIFTIKMAKAVGTEGLGAFFAAPPLTYYEDSVNAAFRWIDAGFPVHINCSPNLGGTGPVTIAGSIISGNAELIAGIVLVQLIKPGTRVDGADFAFPMNMRTGSPAFGAIECSLHQVIFNQMLRRYRIPINDSVAGVPSSSKRIDFQCGYERGMGGLIAALAGANIITFHGCLHGELTHHPIQSVLDDDIVGMINRFMEGVEVNDETLAINLIEDVGPIPGDYLTAEHTRKWWKKEQFIPKAADRLTYPEWRKRGKKSCLDYAKERMDEILATHKPKPLTDDQEDAIENILGEARNYYKEKGMISEQEMREYKENMKKIDS